MLPSFVPNVASVKLVAVDFDGEDSTRSWSLFIVLPRQHSYTTGFGNALNIETLVAAAEQRDNPIEVGIGVLLLFSLVCAPVGEYTMWLG